ncbi:glyoxalase/bleomycin resistance/dioxygenase family protein [Nocardiopsis gilva YIM 90087]|uniref:Glyoxalase/bleomycin resistance/dioxygenase family protein n=1 Tax=Nocardiopsis gilva YIM 90087 TaxID=1235441 RepID=A0A223S5W6_9ACTN|nr:VOC family protein [Nocardiopsis gilva]ASU83511.1 glyoxalase/bleomycin resistance/dioxygenase family protein [Nocardiopsis gilva YIM 90087]
MAHTFQVTFDAHEPRKLGRFWADLLGYQEQPPPAGFATWDEALTAFGVPEDEHDSAYAIVDPAGVGPRIFLQQVPEGKSAKNRVHLDVNVAAQVQYDQRRAKVAEVAERAVELGATRVREVDEPKGYAMVMLDPEGNEFCLQ